MHLLIKSGAVYFTACSLAIWNKKVKILVTGGAGFIGSAVVRHIINNTQDSVVNVDKLTYAGNLESLADVSDSERYFFEHADICDAAAMARIFAQHQPDAVMHLAAESHVDRSITGPAAFIETNIVGTYVLLEAARNYWSGLDDEKKKNFRFHHISTDEVYGDLPHPDEVNSNETLPLFTETTAYAPSSPYSASKASSDHLVRAWKRTYGLPTIVTNCSNNYGPYHFPEKLIPLVILNSLEGKALPIYGKGDQIRDWLYVEDHAPGTGEIPWQEEDATAPLNVYGETKLAGEKALQEHCAKHLIFRTSWVYAGKGNNFAKTMLRLAKEREELAVINDQFGAPTGAELLADCTAHAIRVALNKPEVAGLYHLVASGTTTWHDYAALVFEEARKAGIPLALNKLNAVPTTAYPTPARRPHNSRLNTEKFQQNFALVLPDWQVGVKRMLNELFTTTAI